MLSFGCNREKIIRHFTREIMVAVCEVRDGAKEIVTHIFQSSVITHIRILHNGLTMCVELYLRGWLHAAITLTLPLKL
jgi:hypothetical protein